MSIKKKKIIVPRINAVMPIVSINDLINSEYREIIIRVSLCYKNHYKVQYMYENTIIWETICREETQPIEIVANVAFNL